MQLLFSPDGMCHRDNIVATQKLVEEINQILTTLGKMQKLWLTLMRIFSCQKVYEDLEMADKVIFDKFSR